MTGRLRIFLRPKPFRDTRTSFLCLLVILSRHRNQKVVLNSNHVMSFHDFQFFSRGIYYAFPMKSWWTLFRKTEGKDLCICWENNKNPNRRGNLCVHLPKISNVPICQGNNVWGNGSVGCTVTYLIYCSSRQVNQRMTRKNRCCVSISVNYVRTETQLCTKRTDLNHITVGFE